MQHNSHILRTIFHLTRQQTLFGQLTRRQAYLMKMLYNALESDQQRREAQQIAMLQFSLPHPDADALYPCAADHARYARVTSEPNGIFGWDKAPTSELQVVPMHLTIYLHPDGRIESIVPFSRN